jgi:hypothetical protein
VRSDEGSALGGANVGNLAEEWRSYGVNCYKTQRAPLSKIALNPPTGFPTFTRSEIRMRFLLRNPPQLRSSALPPVRWFGSALKSFELNEGW